MRFNDLFAAYRDAPEVTRQRLYLDTIESVMSKSTKVMVNVKDGNNIFYLPLDKTGAGAPADSATQPARLNPAQMSTIVDEIVNRLRSQSSTTQRKELR